MTPHHTTHLWKRDVGSCCRQFHEDYHDPINGVSCIVDYIVRKMKLYTSTAPNSATDANRTHVYVQEYDISYSELGLELSPEVLSSNSESLANTTHRRNVS